MPKITNPKKKPATYHPYSKPTRPKRQTPNQKAPLVLKRTLAQIKPKWAGCVAKNLELK
jgi:hypothetical protein